jgi:hypothetical protein
VACTNEMYVHHHEKQITGVLHPCTDASPPPSPSNSIGDAEQDSIAAPPARLSSTSTSARLPAERQHLSSSRPLARRGRPPRLGYRRSGRTSRPHVHLFVVDDHLGLAAGGAAAPLSSSTSTCSSSTTTPARLPSGVAAPVLLVVHVVPAVASSHELLGSTPGRRHPPRSSSTSLPFTVAAEGRSCIGAEEQIIYVRVHASCGDGPVLGLSRPKAKSLKRAVEVPSLTKAITTSQMARANDA